MKITKSGISFFREYLISEEKSEATREKYLRDISGLMDYAGNREIDKPLLLRYKEYLLQNHKPSSVNSAICSLNCFFCYNNLHNLRLKSLKVQKQLFLDKSKVLSKKEYEKLLYVAEKKKKKRLFYLMQTICSCGLRISELEFITVSAIKSGKAQITLKGKTRIVFLPRELCKLLEEYASAEGIHTGSIFVTRNGKPLDRSNVWNEMKNLSIEAGISPEKVFPHNLRHLFARTFYSTQKDIVHLADILGHSSIDTTRIYTAENGEKHKKQIEALNLLISK